MKAKKEKHIVWCQVGGSGEIVKLFESDDLGKAIKFADKCEKNPRRYLSIHARDYLRGWGIGVDGPFIKSES